ncbi:MAG: hypothetical protein E4H36_09960 [Spirochaetales bacterium]|nr:MAG: hypothetical protein E4H36_09960 [Spirochaetales bacterium]
MVPSISTWAGLSSMTRTRRRNIWKRSTKANAASRICRPLMNPEKQGIFVMLNGRCLLESRAKISIHDRGFLYGDGFFETILCVDGRPRFLRDHEARLLSSCLEFGINLPDAVHFDDAIEKLTAANGLTTGPARIKIIVTRGKGLAGPGIGFPAAGTPTVLVTAVPYRAPAENLYGKGIGMAVFPQAHSGPLARHKSLNYLFSLAARQYAAEKKAYEALLCDPQGMVLECSAANIYARKGTVVSLPPADAPYLHGVMEKQILKILEEAGYRVSRTYFRPESILSADEVFISNALIGALPVADIDGKPCGPFREVSSLIRRKLEET